MNGNSKLRLGPGVRTLDSPLKSIAEFENWKHSVLYNLKLEPDFKPYLAPSFIFGRKTKEKPSRNLKSVKKDDVVTSAEDRCAEVDFMLEQIAQYLPKIPFNDIVRDCGSLEEVWQTVRLHSNIETSGALLNECWNITRMSEETPQALYSRLKQAYDDNLIRKDTLFYKDEKLLEDEELSPTLHNTIILHWLQILHPRLRDLVTQKFGTELRRATYSSLFPEISRNIDLFLRELSESENASVCRFGEMSLRSSSSRARGSTYPRFKNQYRPPQNSRQCDYCRLMGRQYFKNHSIDDCLFLKREKSYSPQAMSKAFEAEDDDHYNDFYSEYPEYTETPAARKVVTEHLINRVAIYSSPVLTLYQKHKSFNLTLDTGGTCSVIPEEIAKEMECDIRSTLQRAKMADGESDLEVIGETEVNLHRGSRDYKLSALVCRVSGPAVLSILAGMPFLCENDVGIRPFKSQIIIDGDEVIHYNALQDKTPVSRRVSNYTLHSPVRTVILPGESVKYSLPVEMHSETSVVIEPRLDTVHNRQKCSTWPQPKVYEVIEGKVSIPNTSSDPVLIKKHEQVCIVQTPVLDNNLPVINAVQPVVNPVPKKTSDYSAPVKVNPDNILSKQQSDMFSKLLHKYDEVFNPTVSTYNGKSGSCFVEVNMGPVPPPQHKGRVPFYGRSNMNELQEKFDQLTQKGVFCRPQDIGVTVENVNPSFLVSKSNSSDKRLVTDFGSIAGYCRQSPTYMPDVDSTLRQVGSWNYIIKADFTDSYFQLRLSRKSMKYCGVVTPNRGVLCYTVGCMGLPGVECALEELTCLLFGDLVKAGKVAKLADDFFIGGATPEELFQNLEEVLAILLENNLRISAKKTIIAPSSVMLLGWIWSRGHLKASPHILSALLECEPPETASAMKSFLGAYRFLSSVIKSYAAILLPLENMILGKAGTDKLNWTEENLISFKKSQSALRNHKSILLPKPEDPLWIVTDAAVNPTSIGATLYALRNGKTYLCGFYNAKLPVFQRKWLPCEIEGVAIGASLKHYAPYIIQSDHRPCVLTDSKACVQAVDKLNRGQYSASARLCTFLSQVSRYRAEVKHISGVSNLTSDFISRNPLQCTDPKCQVCKFLKEKMSSVVATLSVTDVLDGHVQLPFTNKNAWLEIQNECPDLRRVLKYLQNGTSPGKKGRNLKLVRRYISSKVTISSEGALVVRQLEPFSPVKERIVIPQQVLHGVLTVLHLRLSHPTSHQLQKVFIRHFFALNLSTAISHISKSCHQCSSIKDIPKALIEQSTDQPPERVGEKFAADVVKRNKQNILVLRESVSSYTLAEFLPNETAVEISNGLQRLCNLMRPSPLFPINIRVDPAPGNQSIFSGINTASLKAHNINLEVGRVLNKNKNPVAEKAIRELIREILLISPDGGPLSQTSLSQAVANLNSRIRSSGLSSHELFTQRDQASGAQLLMDDDSIISDQNKRRILSHAPSEKCKAGNKPPHPAADVQAGSIVYIYNDGSKVRARPRYLVLSVDNGMCKLRRLTDKLLGGKTYLAKLTECYKVPDETDVVLPEVTNTEDSDSDFMFYSPTPAVKIKAPRYPCSLCHQDVGNDDQAMKCDTCSSWCHITCGNVSEEEYELYKDSSDTQTWSCPAHPDESVHDTDEEHSSDEHSSGEQDNDVTFEAPPSTIIPANALPSNRSGRNRERKPPDRYGI